MSGRIGGWGAELNVWMCGMLGSGDAEADSGADESGRADQRRSEESSAEVPIAHQEVQSFAQSVVARAAVADSGVGAAC